MVNVEITVPKSIFGRRGNENQARRPVLDMLTKQGDVYHFSKFKFQQTIFPNKAETRKVNRACAHCFPNHSCALDEEVTTLGIKNLFHIPTQNSDRAFPVRKLSSLCYTWESAALSLKKLKFLDRSEMEKDALVLLVNEQSQEDKAKLFKLCKDFCIPFEGFWGSVLFLRFASWLLRKFFELTCDGICIHQGEMELVERAHSTDLPVIYVPLFRSELDPTVLFFVTQSLGLATPYYFSTRSYRYFGSFFGGLGFHGTGHNGSDNLAIANSITFACFNQLLKKRCSVVLNMEQQRSRNGKPSLEIYGMEFLNLLLTNFEDNEIEDAYIVPVNVSYEKLPEHCIKPQFEKSSSNCSSVFKRMLAYLGCKFGLIRVDFGQPFTLREFQAASDTNVKFNSMLARKCTEDYITTYPGKELCWDSNLDKTFSASLSSMYEIDFLDDDDESRFLFLDTLAFHSLAASTFSSTPMASHLVAFLLLKKFRMGTNFNVLCEELDNLKKWFASLGKDVGFTGDTKRVVFHALKVLGSDVVHVSPKNNMIEICPVLTEIGLTELGYYANIVFHFFALEAVVAVALFATIGNKITPAKEFMDVSIKVTDDVLTKEAKKVYSVFTSEFFLHYPCIMATTAIRKAYEHMTDRNLIQMIMGDVQKRARGTFENEMYDDHSDDDAEDGCLAEATFVANEYKVINTNEAYATLSFLRDLLNPYLELYAAIALELERLIQPDQPLFDFEFMEKTLEKLKAEFPVKDYGEFLNMDFIKSALLGFETHDYIYYEFDKTTKRKTICLVLESNEYRVKCLSQKKQDAKQKLRELSNNILHFVTF